MSNNNKRPDWPDLVGRRALIQRMSSTDGHEGKTILDARILECSSLYVKLKINDSLATWYGRYEYRILEVFP